MFKNVDKILNEIKECLQRFSLETKSLRIKNSNRIVSYKFQQHSRRFN